MQEGRVTFGLAPMEGVSELAFRLWMSQTSAPTFMSTPFLRVTDTYPRALAPTFCPELDRYRGATTYELIPQLMAAQPHDFVRTARLMLNIAPFVDLNAGCPSPNPISGGAGSGLLRDPERFLGFMQHLADELPPQRFSLKMRTGFEDTDAFESMIRGLAAIPLRQLTIHGRTRRDRYDHHSRWDLIQRAAQALPYPVVASGDIVSGKSWQDRAHHDIGRVIIGRGALRNPWIFQELREQKPVDIDREILLLAMAVFGLLLEAELHAPETLDRLVLEGFFLAQAGTSRSAWQALYDHVARQLLRPCAPRDLPFDRVTLGRLKMLWNSLRSSLPAPFFAPELLRAKSFSEWVDAWRTLWPDDTPLPLRHESSWDWLYTSSRKRPEESTPLESIH